MPEGDTIHRTAVTLGRALAGKRIQRFRSPLPLLARAEIAGAEIASVEARGKNLLVRLDDGRVLWTHLRMHGSWHIYRPGERWRKPERRARAVIETADFVAVCFDAPTVELLGPGTEDRTPALSGLGPDLLDDRVDLAEAARRLQERGDLAIGDALLVQRAVAGIGNVYKSEALFLARVDPFLRVRDLSDPDLLRLLEIARGLLRANRQGFPRRTRNSLSGERLWVYRRAGAPCLRCGTEICRRRQGLGGRSTWWCPGCQGGPRGPG